jgi:hypothetical protein
VARQDRHEPEDEWDLAVTGRREGEAHAARTDLGGVDDLAVVRAVIGPALLLQNCVTEKHVLGRDRLAVGEARFGAQVESDGAAVLRKLDAFGDQPVERERLVAAARHQALVDVLANVAGRHPPDDESVEAIEGAQGAQHEPITLGCSGIDIREVLEPRRMLRGAMHGDAVHRLGRNGRAQEQANQE